MKFGAFVLILVAGLFIGGCVVGDHPQHPHGMPPGQAKKFVCNHSSSCNHICLDDGSWIEISFGHIHASGCGHILISGVWHVEVGKKPGKGKGKH